jgi:hypothetical protein
MTTDRLRPDLLRAALEEAVRVRGCPPAEILAEQHPDEALAFHLASCFFCRDERELLMELGVEPEPPISAGEEAAERGAVRPGDVRALSAVLGGWGPRGRYYRSPLVLVLEPLPGMAGAVRVCLVHDFPRLAGPGDVELAPGLFAESWNSFPAPIDRLGPAVRMVPGAVLEGVLRAVRKRPDPGAAGSEREDDTPESPYVAAFRRLEVETSAYFSLRLAEEVLAETPEEGRQEEDGIPRDEQEFLNRFSRYIRLERDREPSLEDLVVAPWTDAYLPLAAAGETTLFARLYYPGRSDGVLEAVPVELTFRQRLPEGLLLGGRIRSPLGPKARLEARLVWAGVSVAPREVTLDSSSGFFRLLFPAPDPEGRDPEPGDLHLLVISK